MERFIALKKYSRFVSVTKIICASISLLLLLVVVLMPLINKTEKQVELATNQKAPLSSAQLPQKYVLAPKILGITSNDELYNISASTAHEQEPNLLLLDNIAASIRLKDDKLLSITSNNGKWQQENKILEISGEVKFLLADVYKIITDTAFIDVKRDLAYSNSAVQVESEGTIVKAAGFTLSRKDNTLSFIGPVKTRLTSSTL
jgi:LPS export ABC transporter protein LptC